MAVSRSRKRSVRLAVILPPLFFLTVFGYWRFLGSRAFAELVAVVLGRTLGAWVTIGGHELSRPSEIELTDLQMEFLAEGRPAGLRFKARRASAHAARLLGLGPFEEVVLEDPEARFLKLPDGRWPALTKLELLRRRGGRRGVKKVEFRNMALVFEVDSFEAGGRVYRVGGIDLRLDFSGGGLRMSADLGELRIVDDQVGAESGALFERLAEEKPEIGFGVEIAKSKVVLRDLSVKGRGGWKVEGDIQADLAGEVPRIKGELQLRDLRISTVYKPPPGVSLRTPTDRSAAIRRTIRFEGTAEDLRVSAETDVPEFIYEDERLGLKTEGTTLKGLRREIRTNLKELLRGLFDVRQGGRRGRQGGSAAPAPPRQYGRPDMAPSGHVASLGYRPAPAPPPQHDRAYSAEAAASAAKAGRDMLTSGHDIGEAAVSRSRYLGEDTKVRYDDAAQSGPQRRPRHADRAVPGRTLGAGSDDAKGDVPVGEAAD